METRQLRQRDLIPIFVSDVGDRDVVRPVAGLPRPVPNLPNLTSCLDLWLEEIARLTGHPLEAQDETALRSLIRHADFWEEYDPLHLIRNSEFGWSIAVQHQTSPHSAEGWEKVQDCGGYPGELA
jgi:hypothetical protein